MYANSVLSDLALLREMRKKHGEEIKEERTEEIIEIPSSPRPEPEEPIEDEIAALSLKINETKISSPEETSRRSSPTLIVIHDEVSEEEDKTNEIDSLKLECPICYCELNTDVNSDDYTGCCVGQYCGHALCESCWIEYRRLRNKVCPVCRKLLYIGRGRPPKANVF